MSLMSKHSRLNWNLEVLVFFGKGKSRVPEEKPLGAEKRTNNEVNPHMTPNPGIEPQVTMVGGDIYYCNDNHGHRYSDYSQHCTIAAPTKKK